MISGSDIALIEQIAGNNEQSKKIIIDYLCDSSAAVGDFVYIDSAINNKIIVANTNETPLPVIGVIESKATSTLASVLIIGEYENTGYNLMRGKPVYLDTNGDPTTTTFAGLKQIVGYAQSTTKMLVLPNSRRVRRV